MKKLKQRQILLLLALFSSSLLLLASIPTVAGDNPDPLESLVEARNTLEQELFSLDPDGLVGIAHSEDEGEVIIFVENENAEAKVPRSFHGYTVRTEVTGRIEALSTLAAEPVSGVGQYRKEEVRPLVGGTSVSAYVTKGAFIYSYAGTLGMITYDDKILSNAHVIAMEPGTEDFLDVGTPIIQPGSGDGGRLGERVGELEDYITIDFGDEAQNYADAAIGSVDGDITVSPGEQFAEGANYWIMGWTEISKGEAVRKSGRSTGVTTGEVTHTNASVLVNYGDQTAYFVDQIVVTQEDWSFAAQGDSGSAVDRDGEFVGLVFGGSETHAVVCKAEHVIAGLGIALDLPDDRYSLTISSTEGGSVTDPGEGVFTLDAEEVIDLIAEADEYYQFDRWTGDVDTVGDVHAAATNITMEDSYSIEASFELQDGWHSLTVSSTEGGSVTAPGEGQFIRETGDVVELVAEDDEYYRFVEWIGDVDTVGDVYAAATNITMEDSYSIAATFELEEGKYSLTISSTEGGSVTTPGEGIFIRDAEELVDLIAQPDEDNEFVKWTGNVSTIDDVYSAETTVAMNGSYSIKANFETWHPDPTVQLTVSSTTGGAVAAPGEGVFSYPLGTEVSLVATPEEGYRFVGWSGEVDTVAGTSSASTTITMDSSYSVAAGFDRAAGGCFIATAAYGTPMADEIEILREFRDGYLLTSSLGTSFVNFYYAMSPPIADFISQHPRLKPLVRTGLVPAVAMSTVVVRTTPLEKLAIVALLALGAAALAIRAVRRRSAAEQHC